MTDMSVMWLQWLTFSSLSLVDEEPSVKHWIPISLTLKHKQETITPRKGTQSQTTAGINTQTCNKERCPGVAGSWGRPQIWGWRRSFWGTLRRGVCGGFVSCRTGPSSWCLSVGCCLKSTELLLYFNVCTETKAKKCKMISPSVLKAFSLATSVMAFKAMSERWGASSREIADSEWHLAVSACQRRLRLFLLFVATCKWFAD